MKLNAYSVRDEKAARFITPFFIQTHAEAIRVFGENVLNEKTMWHKYPEDFRLYYIGSFDEESAQLESKSVPLHLSSAIDFVNRSLGLNEAGKALFNGKKQSDTLADVGRE